jgi:large subunit ribosomal protein L6
MGKQPVKKELVGSFYVTCGDEMSRLGKTPIKIPSGVKIVIDKKTIEVSGGKGTLSFFLVDGIVVKMDNGFVLVEMDENFDLPNAFHGLYRALLNNMVLGVSQGFLKKLLMIGVGYKASVQNGLLDLQIGKSHPTQLAIPKELQVSVDKNTTIIIAGIDKQAVGQFAATIRSLKPPEPYKGKGIRYEDEYVRKKAGKAAKSKTAGG